MVTTLRRRFLLRAQLLPQDISGRVCLCPIIYMFAHLDSSHRLAPRRVAFVLPRRICLVPLLAVPVEHTTLTARVWLFQLVGGVIYVC
jgi:hypothetical protein